MPKFIDLTGQRYGRLTVLKRAENRGKRIYWKCQCDCGKIIETRGDRLREGRVKSCGCWAIDHAKEVGHLNEKNLLGQVFNKLTVIERSPIIHNDHCAYWICKCECGNITEVSGPNLRTGNTKSCGCLKSNGEQLITGILQNNNVNYKKEYTFSNLKTNQTYASRLRFDYAIFDNNNNNLLCLIEYQGYQHYDINNQWHRPESDLLKRKYCQDNNIKLIEIKYTDLNQISWNYLKEKIYD